MRAIIRAMAFFLGIDGGGTKTTCLLGDETQVLASETTGGSNVIRLGEAVARTAIHQGIQRVCAKAGILPEQIAAVCAGVGGAVAAAPREQIQQIILEMIPGKVEVLGDMVVAHETALGGAPGIVVIAGTGSIAYGRNEAGKAARSGGLGYVISDEGSGHWIGVQAVALIGRLGQGGRSTALGDRVLRRWRLKSVDELVEYANSSPMPDFSALFPDILDHEGRDPFMHRILERAGRKLAHLTLPVYRNLWIPSSPVQVALSGGVFRNSVTVRELFQQELKQLRLNARCLLSDADPAAGALALARKLVLSSTHTT